MFLKKSNQFLLGKYDFEISHHYGLEKFYQFGLVMITILNRNYCKKILVLLPGQKHPEQWHNIKEETFHVLYGKINLKLNGISKNYGPGSLITIKPKTKHEFSASKGAVIEEISTPLLLIIPKGREKETIKRLARVGFDNTLGYLKGGFTSWKDAGKKIDYINTISPNKFEEKSKKKSLRVYDVRKPFEFNTSHLKNSINIPLNNLNKKIKESEKENELFLLSNWI